MIFLISLLNPWSEWLLDLSLTNLPKVGPEFCQYALPVSPYRALYAALVCGVSLPSGHEKQIFVDTGLIHLMVVSGSHLVFIERLTGFLPNSIRLVLGGAYAFLTGFQAPVMRAWMRRIFLS